MCVPGCQEAVRHALSRRGFFKGALAASFGATAVAPEIAGAAPARSFTSVVDLTHTMSPDFPTFFGVPGIEMDKKFDLKKDGFNLYWWRIVEHAGTHLDAPIHFSEAGATAEKISADTLVVPLAVVDVAAKAARNPDYLLTTEDLADWEKKHHRLPDNCCVAMQSGWAQHVVGLAVDTLSLDHGPSKDFKVHYGWLPSGRWGLENVANLDKVPPSGAMLVVGLAKVKDATGGPARLIALV